MQELWLLRFAHLLMLTDIHIKFCEDILNGFQVKLYSGQVFYDGQSSKGNNSKKYKCKSYESCALHVI